MTTAFPTPSWPDELRDRAAVRSLAESYWDAISTRDAQSEREFERVFPAVRAAGELDKDLFVKVARWKSVRKTPSYLTNREEAVREATRRAFRATTPAAAIGALCVLDGVALRTATALLHWIRPAEFPILDVRTLEAMGWPKPTNFDDTMFYETFARVVIARSRELGVSLRVLDRALWTWSKLRSQGGQRPVRTSRTNTPAPVPALGTIGSARPTAGGSIDCWISNIASQAERARPGDLFELCINKQHASLFPPDGGVVELVVAGRRWRGTVGVKPRVAHVYLHTGLSGEGARTSKITAVLQQAGFAVGDRPRLRVTGLHSFDLDPAR